MPIDVNPAFTLKVIAGFVVSLVGALLALAASVWCEHAEDRAHGGRPPAACRAFCGAALGLFFIGTLWQLLGYLLLEYTIWWTW
jgi:hypothetical protein